ncbi:MAG: hypothetical protein ACAH59_05360 [Pseudobdellovibrionaceae bacterium]
MQISLSNSLLKSSAGMSLMSVIIGMAMMGLLALASANILADTKRAEMTGEVSSFLSQSHTLSIYKTRSLQRIRAILMASANANCPAARMSACLAGTGTSCLLCANPDFVAMPALSSTFTENRIVVRSLASYQRVCTSDSSCGTVRVRVASTSAADTSRGIDAMRRDVEFHIAGAFLGDKSDFSFACTSGGKVVTGIDQASRQAKCEGMRLIGPSNCTSAPVNDLNAGLPTGCATMASIDCPRGIRRIGLMSGQGVCL